MSWLNRYSKIEDLSPKQRAAVPSLKELLMKARGRHEANPGEFPSISLLGPEIAKELGIGESDVREIVSCLRRLPDPWPVGSEQRGLYKGYFFARKAEELDRTKEQLMGRKAILEADIWGIERVQVAMRCGKANQETLL